LQHWLVRGFWGSRVFGTEGERNHCQPPPKADSYTFKNIYSRLFRAVFLFNQLSNEQVEVKYIFTYLAEVGLPYMFTDMCYYS